MGAPLRAVGEAFVPDGKGNLVPKSSLPAEPPGPGLQKILDQRKAAAEERIKARALFNLRLEIEQELCAYVKREFEKVKGMEVSDSDRIILLSALHKMLSWKPKDADLGRVRYEETLVRLKPKVATPADELH